MSGSRHGHRQRQMRAFRRYAFIALLVVVLVSALPWMLVALFVDADALRARVEHSVLGATGRTLSFGSVTMLRSLPPTIAAQDVVLANPPGASRAEMLKVPYVEATLGIVPLLLGRLDITSLLLSRPDLLLEADVAGAANWRLAALLPTAPAPASRRVRWIRRHASRAPAPALLEQLRIRDGRLAWRDDVGLAGQLEISRLDAAAPGMQDSASVTALLRHAGRTVALNLHTGRLDRLRPGERRQPWPVTLALDTEHAHFAASGSFGRPWELGGYVLALTGTADNLADLEPLLHVPLPPLRRFVFQTHIADSGGDWPDISGISIRARGSDLDSWINGLRLDELNLSADSFDQPVHVELGGSFADRPLSLVASLGAPAALLSPGRVPGRFPIEIEAAAAGSTLGIRGAIAAPERGTGLELEAAAAIPDLAALSPLFGHRLPGLGRIVVNLRAGDGAGGFRQGIAVRDLAVGASALAVGGQLDLRFGARPALRAVLDGRMLDLDALRAALPGAAPPGAGAPRGPWLIPNERLPFDLLTRFDLDLRAAFGEVRLGGTTLSTLAVSAMLQDGRLQLDPLAAALPDGRLEIRLGIDAHGRLPPVSLSVAASGVPAQPVLAALGLPGEVAGTLDLGAVLRGAGASWHEISAGLSGRLGLVLNGGELDPALLAALFGPALQAANVALPGPGRIPARCAALRLDADRGVLTMRSFALDTPSLLLEAEGALQLRDERLAVRLRPQPRGAAASAPIRIGGVLGSTTVYAEQRPPTSRPAIDDACQAPVTNARAAGPTP